jgi:hypothetical protein
MAVVLGDVPSAAWARVESGQRLEVVVKPSERRRMVTGLVAAVVVVAVLWAARAWQGVSGPWVFGATIVVVVGWGAWMLWSASRDRDRDDSSDG